MNTTTTGNLRNPNLAIIEKIYNAFNNKDMQTFLSALDPSITMLQCHEVPWGGFYKGIDEVREFIGKKVPMYFTPKIELHEQIIDSGDRIAVLGRVQGRMHGAELDFDVAMMHLWEFKNNLAIRLEIILDLPEMSKFVKLNPF